MHPHTLARGESARGGGGGLEKKNETCAYVVVKLIENGITVQQKSTLQTNYQIKPGIVVEEKHTQTPCLIFTDTTRT
jgi:hypothetical protein